MGKTQYNLGVYQSYSVLASRDRYSRRLLHVYYLSPEPVYMRFEVILTVYSWQRKDLYWCNHPFLHGERCGIRPGGAHEKGQEAST